MNHIRDSLPELRARINKLASETQNELLSYGDPMYDSKQSQGALLLQLITRFASDFRDSIDGRGAEYSTNELFGGARINYIFTENYAKCLSHIDPTDGLSLSDIRTAIKNVTVRS